MDDTSFSPPTASDSNSTDIVELNKKAIEAAMSQNWEEAVKLNNEIIKEEPENIACMNRLGHALFEVGDLPKSKKTYQQVLEMDPYNVIAQKNIKKIESFKNGLLPSNHTNGNCTISPALFLSEPGITQVVNLTKLAEPQKLLMLSPGTMITLVSKNRGIVVVDGDNGYLGALPDDIAHSLARFIKGGNKYQALVKSAKANSVTVLLREVFRSKKFKEQPSFLNNSAASTYSSKHIVVFSDETPVDDLADDNEDMD